MNRLLLLGVACGVVTYLLAHVYRLLATAFRMVDAPNHRSAHEGLVPTGAGVSFVLVFVAGLYLVSQYEPFTGSSEVLLRSMPALIGVAVVGFFDDYRPLSWKTRFLVHAISCAYIVRVAGVPIVNALCVEFNLGFLGNILTVLSLIWLLNLYNFMDGIDGIAIGEAVCVLVFAAAIAFYLDLGSATQPAILLLSCSIGFLVINWPRARVFMGDGGSGFLGLTFGVFVVTETMVPIWSWLILLGWFVTDASLTIVLRLLRRQRIHEAHSEHAYQHLNRAVGTSKTLLIVGLFNAVYLLPLAAQAASSKDWGFGLVLLAYVPLIIVQYCCGAGQQTPKLFLGKRN